MNEDVFNRALALIPQIREEILRQVPFELQGMIGLEMNRTAVGDKSKNTTDILNVRKGNLFRSFTKGNKFNILKKTSSGMEYGSLVPYAAIHEYGGTINHPGTKNGFGKGIPIPAHNIDMPKRSYLAPAIKKYEAGELDQTINRALQPLKNLFA